MKITQTQIKKYSYLINSNTIWTSFDHGTVEAETENEAMQKAIEKLKYDFKKVNDALYHCDNTNGFTVDFSDNAVTVAEIQQEQPQEHPDVLYDFIYCNLATPDDHAVAVEMFKSLTEERKQAMYEFAHNCDTDFSNWGNYENGKAPTLEDSKNNILFLVNEWKLP